MIRAQQELTISRQSDNDYECEENRGDEEVIPAEDIGHPADYRTDNAQGIMGAAIAHTVMATMHPAAP